MYHLDFETYSDADIKNGAYRYASDPSTRILMFAISEGDGDPLIWTIDDNRLENDEAFAMFEQAINSGGFIYAHNYQFELAICHYRLLEDVGITPPRIEQWRCTAAMCCRAAIPQSLKEAAKFLGGDEQKDDAGRRLIQLFSCPQKGGHRIMPDEEGEVTVLGETLSIAAAWHKFVDYCIQDVRTERMIQKKLTWFDYREPVPTAAFYQDARMNHRGVPVNIEALKSAQRLTEEAKKDITAEFEKLTCLKPTQLAKVLQWLQDGGYPGGNMQAHVVAEILEDMSTMDEDAQKALKLYALQAYSSLSKIPAMLRCACPDGRVRGTLKWSGAIRTHRWTGKLIQPQNIRKSSIPDPMFAYEAICEGADLEELQLLWESPLEVIASVVRHFIQDVGHNFLDVDYSNIEARILPWLAGEKKILQHFTDNEDIYVKFASILLGVAEEKVDKAGRNLGKTGVLGCGYGSGVETFAKMMKEQYRYTTPEGQVRAFLSEKRDNIEKFNRFIRTATEKQIAEYEKKSPLARMANGGPIDFKTVESFLRHKLAKKIIGVFRSNRTPVVNMWKEFDTAAKEAIKNPGMNHPVANGKVRFLAVTESQEDGIPFDMLMMRLPSGHCLIYPKPELVKETKKLKDEQGNVHNWEVETIKFYGQIPNTHKWGRIRTYGPQLVGHCTQATAGDILTHNLLKAEEAGFDIFMIVHDQALAYADPEVPDGRLQEFIDCLTDLPEWAKGLPLDAEGGVVPYYLKD